MLVRVVLQTLAPVARRTLGPVGHATLAPVDHAILVPEADGIARPFVNDSNTPPNKKNSDRLAVNRSWVRRRDCFLARQPNPRRPSVDNAH